jgi:hypothetical protein
VARRRWPLGLGRRQLPAEPNLATAQVGQKNARFGGSSRSESSVRYPRHPVAFRPLVHSHWAHRNWWILGCRSSLRVAISCRILFSEGHLAPTNFRGASVRRSAPHGARVGQAPTPSRRCLAGAPRVPGANPHAPQGHPTLSRPSRSRLISARLQKCRFAPQFAPFAVDRFRRVSAGLVALVLPSQVRAGASPLRQYCPSFRIAQPLPAGQSPLRSCGLQAEGRQRDRRSPRRDR